jgi:hypothetical protein
VIVRSLTEADQSWTETTLVSGWSATTPARLGELVDAAPLLVAVVAVVGDERVSLLTYVQRADY